MNKMTREGEPSYTSHLASSLNQFRQEGTLCDVTIVVANQRFQAHKAVLSAGSSYFRSMFASGFQERDSSEVDFQGRANVFAQLLEFAYTGYFNLSAANALSVLKMASYMDFNQAIDVCKDYLMQHVDQISIEDVYDIITCGEIQDDLSEMVQEFRTRLLHDFLHFFEKKSVLNHATKEFVMTCLEDEDIETDDNTEDKVSVEEGKQYIKGYCEYFTTITLLLTMLCNSPSPIFSNQLPRPQQLHFIYLPSRARTMAK